MFRKQAVPFSKMLTFYKADTFSVSAEYVSQVPFPDKQIGVFDISMTSTGTGIPIENYLYLKISFSERLKLRLLLL